MKFGFNMLLWTGHVTAEHFPIFGRLKAAGYDGAEIPLFEGDAAHFKTVRQALDDHGLKSTTVTVMSPEANPISPEASRRAAAVDHLKWALEMTSILGGDILCGPMHSPLAVFSGQGPTAEEKQRAAEVLRQAAGLAASHRVTLALEYLNRFECYFLTTAKEARALVQAIDHPHCRMMFDTFHANIEEKHAGPAIESIRDVLAHVHISENDRGTPGTGNVAWKEVFHALKAVHYDGWMTVEAFGRALPALAAATKIWRDLFPADEPWQKGIHFMKESWKAAEKS